MPKHAVRTRPIFYNLEGTTPVPCEPETIQISDHKRRQVARITIGKYLVSTVFLGLDHAWSGPPLLFETMVFKDNNYGSVEYEQRYSTWYEAEKGHVVVCAMIQNGTFEKLNSEE